MSLCKYREKKMYCGDFLDVDIFPVFSNQKNGRKKRYRPTSETQKKLNEKNAQKRLERLLHTNFTEEDYALHLTYEDCNLPSTEDEAKKDIQNYLRRLKREYKKQGAGLKYISVTEKGKKTKRLHHHLVISGGIDRSKIEKMWKKGYANSRGLRFTKDGLAGLAFYITKQPLYFKRWSCSRNLKQPKERKSDSRYNRAKARYIFEYQYKNEEIEKLYPGYALASVEPVFNEVNSGYYVSLRLYKKEARYIC